MPWAALAAPPRERTRSVEPAGFDLDATTIGGRRIAVREAVVSARPFPTLSHFEGAVKRRDPRVLVIAPLSGHHPTVLYQMVATLLPDHDVYLAGWRNARDVPLDEDPFDLDTYIEYVQQFIVELGPELHVIAVSQATVPALATVALAAAPGQPAPRSLTLVCGPVDARRSPTFAGSWVAACTPEWSEQHMLSTVPPPHAGAGRRVYPGFLQSMAHLALDPYRPLAIELERQAAAWAQRAVPEEHRVGAPPREAPLADLPAEFYVDTLRVVFRDRARAHDVARDVGDAVRNPPHRAHDHRE
ncbi:MAG: polyhydroxyalkanoate depolymerase [Chloroflexi bacterium]|nr:polyhydroxyalkanoate depolymerase [Chloroflexota bacterium]